LRVNSINSPYSKTAFSAVRLYNVKLKKTADEKPIKAFFAELKPDEDAKLLKEISELWTSDSIVEREFTNYFLQPGSDKRYAVILNNPSRTQAESTVSLVSASRLNVLDPSRKVMEINLLQSVKERGIKGAGELAVYGIVRKARDEGYEKVVLGSVENAFYDKIKFSRMPEADLDFQQIGNTPYEVKGKRLEKFLSRVEIKYSFNSAKRILQKIFGKIF